MLAATALKDPGFIPRSPLDEDVEYGCAAEPCGGHGGQPLGLGLAGEAVLALERALEGHRRQPLGLGLAGKAAALGSAPAGGRVAGRSGARLRRPDGRSRAQRRLACRAEPTLGLLGSPGLQHGGAHQGPPDQRLHRHHQVLHHLQAGGACAWLGGAAARAAVCCVLGSCLRAQMLCRVRRLRVPLVSARRPRRRPRRAATTARRAARTAPCATTAWTSLITTARGWAPA